jgi:alkylation response protein AidB-like acyl-CoA dehydrogenase
MESSGNPVANPIPAVIAQNRYTEDPALRALLDRHVCPPARAAAEPWLTDMGALSAGPINDLAFQADAHPPPLERYDARGQRDDRIVYHPAHLELERLSFGRGIIGHFYDPANRAALSSHLWQVKFAMCYLFAQAEQGVYCPIAMTDAAAHLVRLHASPELRDRYLPLLTSCDERDWAQGAMFLTEREGGSDVGANTTVARADGNLWRLTGDKWFCSNVGAEVMMVLARAGEAKALALDGAGGEGTRGLGLFLVPRTIDGLPNSMRIKRLKNKLGTRSIPTGEVSFREAVGYALGPVERGFHTMTDMLNVCRMHNATASLALTRRVLWEAATYLRGRRTFGNSADSYGLVQDTLCGLFAELEGGLEALFSVARDFADVQADPNADAETRGCLRLLTPMLKLQTARLAVRAASEAVELIGGNGYIEECVTARFLRDAQVLPVWEGTTNILYLDALRWIVKEQAHHAVCRRIERLGGDVTALRDHMDAIGMLPPHEQPVRAKRLCDALWRTYLVTRLEAVPSLRLAAVAARLAGRPALPLREEYDAVVRGGIG